MLNTDDVLYIRCADGRTKRPDNILGLCAHQERTAGGVLNAYFKARFSRVKLSLEDRIDDQMEDYETMIGLKKPSKVILASHAHCGAAGALGYTHEEVHTIHEEWAQRIRDFYLGVEVEVVHENHSTCGHHREWETVGSGK